MRQTAVQWLIETITLGISEKGMKSAFEKALEMEKKQHKKTWAEGLFCETGDLQAFEEYYNENYETKTN